MSKSLMWSNFFSETIGWKMFHCFLSLNLKLWGIKYSTVSKYVVAARHKDLAVDAALRQEATKWPSIRGGRNSRVVAKTCFAAY